MSTETAERSFSSLRRLKNYMRSTMTKSRLNGLALLNIHNNKYIDIDEVVNDTQKKNAVRGLVISIAYIICTIK